MNETGYIRFSIATAVRLDISASVELANIVGDLVQYYQYYMYTNNQEWIIV